jgi:hypothetical protein
MAARRPSGDLGGEPPAESELWAATLLGCHHGNTDAEPTTDGEQKLAPEEDKASPPGSPRPKRVARPNLRMSGPEWTVKFASFWVLWVSSRKCESSDLN